MELNKNGQEILDVNKKKYQKLLWGTGFVIIVLILTLFVMSQTYIQNLVYHERLSQMEEVTHQMFHSSGGCDRQPLGRGGCAVQLFVLHPAGD